MSESSMDGDYQSAEGLREYLKERSGKAREEFIKSSKLRNEALALGRHNAYKDVLEWLDER